MWLYNLVWMFVLGGVRLATERLARQPHSRRMRRSEIVNEQLLSIVAHGKRRLNPADRREEATLDYRKKLIVKPGSKVRLKDIDPGYHGKHESRGSRGQEISTPMWRRLTALQ